MASAQTNWPYVINLGNSIIGVSVLAMPFCFRQCGVLLGMLLLFSSAGITHVSCNLLIKSAISSRKRSYEFLAFHTFGPAGKLAVEISIIGLLIGTCIAFFVIIGDLGPAIISRMLEMENTYKLRSVIMVTLAFLVALPLGLLRSVESLSNISAASLSFYSVFICMVVTAAFPHLWSGVWVKEVTYWNPEGVFKCLPIFSLAYACQTQLFLMYDALPEPSLKRMNTITKSAVGMCTAIYLSVGYFGYVAFCTEEIQGDILMNFKPTIFSEAIKLGFVLSVAVSFPLVIFPCRASIYTLLFAQHGTHDNITGPTYIPELHFKLITIGIVVFTLTVGILVPNIEFILAMTGATMGSMICYIFPAVMFISIMSMVKNQSKSTAQFVLFMGVTILLASTYVTLNSQDQREEPFVPLDQAGGDMDNDEGAQNKDKDVDQPNHIPRQDSNLEDDPGDPDDRRQEPPNPHAPIEGDQLKEDNKEGGKAKDDDTADDTPIEKSKVGDVKEEDRANEVDSDKEKGNDKEEAKELLAELKEQQKVQEQLINEQKEIIAELKQHNKEAHGNDDTKHEDKPADEHQDVQPDQQLHEKRDVVENNQEGQQVQHVADDNNNEGQGKVVAQELGHQEGQGGNQPPAEQDNVRGPEGHDVQQNVDQGEIDNQGQGHQGQPEEHKQLQTPPPAKHGGHQEQKIVDDTHRKHVEETGRVKHVDEGEVGGAKQERAVIEGDAGGAKQTHNKHIPPAANAPETIHKKDTGVQNEQKQPQADANIDSENIQKAQQFQQDMDVVNQKIIQQNDMIEKNENVNKIQENINVNNDPNVGGDKNVPLKDSVQLNNDNNHKLKDIHVQDAQVAHAS